MERNAHYALVGLVSAALLVGLILFVVWLAKVQFNNQYALYDIDFKGPVRGLSSGGEVYFNGIKVGEVTKLSLDRRDPNRVVARVRITADAPVRADSLGSLEPQGVTGVSYVQITAGSPTRPLLREVTPEDQIPVIHTTQGALEGLLQGGGDVLARSVEALDRVNRLMSDQNMANFTAILANTRDATALAKNQGQLLSDLDATVRELNATSQHIDTLTLQTNALVNGQGRTTLANLDAAAIQLRATAADAQTTLFRLSGPASDFASNGLPQLSRTIITLQAAAESLDRLVGEVEENPRQLLTKPPAKTVEVQP
jgi:phospholipid/cholesterol/gamma-HCH transport system substrate-binding protein